MHMVFLFSVGESEHAGPKEVWAYVTVRPGARMFYWLYHTTHTEGYENRPLILWLQVFSLEI